MADIDINPLLIGPIFGVWIGKTSGVQLWTILMWHYGWDLMTDIDMNTLSVGPIFGMWIGQILMVPKWTTAIGSQLFGCSVVVWSVIWVSRWADRTCFSVLPYFRHILKTHPKWSVKIEPYERWHYEYICTHNKCNQLILDFQIRNPDIWLIYTN